MPTANPTFEERYLIGETLTSSRNCQVFKAKRKSDGVAVIVKKNLRPADRAVREGLRRAYLFTQNGRIPKSIQSLALEDEGSATALVILDEGLRSLDSLSLEGLSLESRLQLAYEMTLALASVHQAALVHRDIKPSNFLVGLDPIRAQLSDFDAAGFVHQEISERVFGTPAYMSPEQTGKLQRNLDRRSDLYSLGVTFYELFSGRLPFEWRTTEELLAHHLSSPPDPLPNHLPISLQRLIFKLLQKEPLQRYQSADGVLADLKRLAAAPWDIFAVGRHDIPSDFNWPGELIGRQLETEKLANGYRQACLGRSHTFLVAGKSGIGKSALLSVIRWIASAHGSVVGNGKFDQFDRTQPFSAFLQALSQAQQYLLALPEDQLEALARRVRESVGQNLWLLQKLLPATASWLGPSVSPAVELSAGDHRKQVIETVVLYLRCLANPSRDKGQPLVLVIDDLQWADSESLSLMQTLSGHPDLPDFLLLGAYRSDEVEPTHPVHRLAQGLEVELLELSELTGAHLADLVQRIALCPQGDAQELAELLQRKTLGNPFYVRQFLQAARQDALIGFDASRSRWVWSLESLEQRPITANVLPLVDGRIRRLPAECLQSLQKAACAGATFSCSVLALLDDQPLLKVWEKLLPAFREELICQNSDGDHISFAHDSVQQAVYLTLQDDLAVQIHAELGVVLLELGRTSEAVNHLNLGRPHLDNQHRSQLNHLNLQTAKTALQSSAYDYALHCLRHITGNWQANIESGQLDGTFQREVYLTLAQASAYTNDEEALDLYIQLGSHLCGHPLEQVQFLQSRLFFDINRIQWEKVLVTGFDTLGLLGQQLPTQPDQDVVQSELGATLQALGPAQQADILALPDMTDPVSLATAQVFKAITTAAYFSRPNLYPIVVFRIVRLSLEKGLCAESAAGFLGLGVVHAAMMEHYPRAEELGIIAQAIADRFSAHALQGYLSMVYHAFIHHWGHRIQDSISRLGQGADLALAAGDTEFWSYCWYWQGAHLLYTGGNLNDLYQRLLHQWVATERRGQKKGRLLLHLLHTISRLFGPDKKSDFGREVPGDIDTEVLEQLWSEASDWNGLSYSRGFRAIAHFYLDEFEECAQLLTSCQPFLPYLLGQSYFCQVSYHQAVSQIRCQQMDEASWSVVQDNWKKWSSVNPVNYLHKYCSIQAEYARHLGRHAEAFDYYLQAIKLAKENNFFSDLAWLHRSVGELYLQQNDRLAALAHLDRAIELFQHWGADKLAQIVRQHTLHLSEMTNQKIPLSALTTVDMVSENLDIAALLRASESLTQVADAPAVLDRVTQLILQNSGATYGRLWLVGDELLDLPETLVRFVTRSLEIVILNGGVSNSAFASDPYLASKRPVSILCCPLTLHSRLLGVLYLENEFISSVFSMERLKAVHVIALQAAISTEILRQFDRLRIQQEELLKERERAHHQALQAESLKSHNRSLASFLGIASHDLQTPLAVIRMWSQNLKPGASEPLVQRCRTIFEKSVEQATSLIQSYLDAVTTELGQELSLRRQPTLLSDLVISEVEFHQASQSLDPLPASQLQLEEISLPIDPLRIRQVIRNLIGNAFNHSDSGHYSVRVWQDSHCAFLEVSNPCEPLGDDFNQKLFHAFAPGQSSQGRGFGLWICRTLVEAHQGKITVEYCKDKGIVFLVSLPRA